jgi:hypothetical protein
MEEIQVVWNLMRLLVVRLAAARESEGGYSTEAVIVTGLLVAMALTAIGIIAAKVISTANGIQTSGN